MMYTPKPENTDGILLDESIEELCEQLAKNTHEVWAAARIREGWTYGPKRDDLKKETPCLVPYEELPEAEKEYDRATSRETLRLIRKLGFRIVKE